MKRLTRYLWPIALCMSVGFSASLFQREAIAEWYPFLNKPVLTPPNGAFPIVWGILYILIGISLGRIWGKGLKVSQREWWIQLALNFCWSIAFFFLREPLWGMGIILILDVVVLDYILITFKKDKLAAACFMPYILWLLWATYLNAYNLYLQLTQRTSATVSAYRHVLAILRTEERIRRYGTVSCH